MYLMLYYIASMLDKIVYSTLHWLMKWSGQLNAWAWRKHVKMIEKKREEENEQYVKELKNKL